MSCCLDAIFVGYFLFLLLVASLYVIFDEFVVQDEGEILISLGIFVESI